jgi:hypothetical protein
MHKGIVTALCHQHKDKFRKYTQYNRKLIFLYGFIVLSIFIPGCSTNSDTNEYPVEFLTDRKDYLSTDTITVMITNNSKDVFYIGLRCGACLEMSYQKKENGVWSENRWFWYSFLGCATFIDSILSNERHSYEQPAECFDDVGTFRLVMGQLYSNRFTID